MDRQDEMEQLYIALWLAWKKHPQLRLGQLVTNAAYFDAEGNNLGYAPPAFAVEDEAMLDGLIGVALND